MHCIKKAKKLLATALLFVMLLGNNGYAAQYENLTELGLQSKCQLLMEADTGTIIYEKNSHEALPPASVTKIMTMLLIFEANAQGKFNWEDPVTVSEHAASMGGSQVFLEPFEQQTAKDMLKCIAIASANDAAVSMAEFIAGSEDAFVEKMNQKAAELGMKDAHFENACGLDAEGHVTSAYDIALMSRELITKYPDIFQYTTVWQDTIVHKTKKGESEFGLTNTNKLLKWYDGATGLKTGSTGKALYCLSGTAEKNGMKLIGVVMAAPDFKVRFQEVMQLFDYGYANYSIEKIMEKEQSVCNIPVTKGMLEQVEAITAQDVSVLLPKGSASNISKKVTVLPSLQAPFSKGQKVGEIQFLMDGKEISKTDLVTMDTIEKINLSEMVKKLFQKWLTL